MRQYLISNGDDFWITNEAGQMAFQVRESDGEENYRDQKALITPLRNPWTVKFRNGPDMDMQGNILDHEYEIKAGRRKVTQVSRKWFKVRDTCGGEIAPGEQDVVILAVTAAVVTWFIQEDEQT